ncbi:MAG: GNAT family N-acetyltransferase [Pseudomonadales bacterium]|nr:GNAT family N-acetyltransferase [Pseudomonadales bacterium]
MTKGLEIRQFHVREAYWDTHGSILGQLRQQVFVLEQNVPPGEEQDGLDETSWHWLATDASDNPIGTARLLHTGQIGRMAVLSNHRGNHVGLTLLEQAVEKARYLGFRSVFLHAQSYAVEFYIKAGFSLDGEEFLEAGIQHIQMRQDLKPTYINSPPLQKAKQNNEQAVLISTTQTMAQSSTKVDLILLRKEEEFHKALIALCQHAQRKIRIFSTVLDHKIFDSETLRDIFSNLARRNRYTFIEILLKDSHRIVKNGHILLELSKKLPSSIRFKTVDPELNNTLNEYILIDHTGVIFRQDSNIYSGYARSNDKTSNNRLDREFCRAWANGFDDPNLRQLKI